ncbi:hypothetical protein RFI_00518 [Reticulomyxa filosa]|uniref:AAA+ ATPase domain-containing protein n=1 Tax=Reticulomyxa filosa TaxID=46433 RepID=X6PEL0_RETFI|nr:hypothetical protein RFI_00518 [Reticulomyxa filosa]|eukprot:ETO36543.1 hypothetical protein RFI_00518 [Reticulomyxa filosa]
MQQYETILKKDKTLLWTEIALNIALGIYRIHLKYHSHMVLHNTFLKNLFILFFCVVTSTSVIVVGKPGTFKTLSLQILLDTLSHHNIKQLNQKLKDNQFHFNVFYSKVQEIANQIERYSNDKIITTLLIFDEIGLAEQSPYNPLKILHHPKISFVGISNWSLDAAKMNRIIIHSIPLMYHNELMETTKAILKNSNSTFSNIITDIIVRHIFNTNDYQRKHVINSKQC